MLFTTLFTAIIAATSSMAAPLNTPQELIVFNPHITSPVASVSWTMGSKQTVKWDTKGLPQHMANTTGLLLLGYMENDSENLDIDRPLASSFPINKGSVNIVMPHDIPARPDYFVVLFGDSGNRSPKFKIH